MHPEYEVFLVRIAREVFEWQDGDPESLAGCLMRTSALEPSIDLGVIRVDAGLFLVDVAVDRKALLLLPSPERARIATEVDRDLFPGLQSFGGTRIKAQRP